MPLRLRLQVLRDALSGLHHAHELRAEDGRSSNFVHGVVVVGAMVALGQADTVVEQAIGFFAVALGAANAAGGYVVTERMLGMFKKKEGA